MTYVLWKIDFYYNFDYDIMHSRIAKRQNNPFYFASVPVYNRLNIQLDRIT